MATTIGTSWTEIAKKSANVNGATITFYLEAKRGTQSVANNTTPIDIRLRSVFSGYYMYSYGYSFSATYCTTKSSSSGQWNAATETILTGSKTVSHNSDGTWSGTLTANAKMSGLFDLSLSGSVSVPTIPRASTPTLSPNTIVLNGTNSTTISTNRASNSFTHTITWACGSKSGTIGTNITDSVKWTPPMSLITEFYSSASTTATITTKTYNGTTLIGTTTSTLTLTNPGGDAISVSPNYLTISSRNSNMAVQCSPLYSGFGHNVYYKISGGTRQGISLGSPTFPVNWKPYVSLSQWPTKTTTTCEIIVETTYNNTVIYNGTRTITVTLTVDTSVYKPTISNFSLTEQDSKASSIENSGEFIRYISDVLVKATVGMVTDSGSTLKSVKIENGTQSTTQTSGTVSTTFNNIIANSVKITATDTRGVTVTETKTFTLIPYVLLTIASEQEREDPTSDNVIASYNGAYYNGSLGQVQNSLTLTYKYRESGTTNWTTGTGTLTATPGSNSTYKGSGTLAEAFDYQKQYDLQITATDGIMSVTRQLIIYQGVPIYHWGVHDDNGNHFDIEGDLIIHQTGVPTNYNRIIKESVGTLANEYIYSNQNLKNLPNGEDTNDYWASLRNGVYWYGNTNAVPNLPASYGMLDVTRLGAYQTTVLFRRVGGTDIWYKWCNQTTNSPWVKVNPTESLGVITDLNIDSSTLVAGRFYTAAFGGGAANRPSGVSDGILFIFPNYGGNTWGRQVSFSDGGIYTRSWGRNGYNAWVKVGAEDSGWITLNDTAKVYYRKKNGMVTVVINNMNNKTLTSGDNLGTLPAGYRPAYVMQARNSFDNANGRLAIYGTGIVEYQSNVGTANYIRCSISYPVDD